MARARPSCRPATFVHCRNALQPTPTDHPGDAVRGCRVTRPSAARGHLAASIRVVRAVIRNPALRRIELAFLLFNAVEFGTWVAILLYAYDTVDPPPSASSLLRNSRGDPRTVRSVAGRPVPARAGAPGGLPGPGVRLRGRRGRHVVRGTGHRTRYRGGRGRSCADRHPAHPGVAATEPCAHPRGTDRCQRIVRYGGRGCGGTRSERSAADRAVNRRVGRVA